MKFETLKSFNKKKLIIPTIIICSIIIVITIFISHSKYIYKDSITIIDGTVNYKPYDFKIVAIYVQNGSEYEEIGTMPENGYNINQELSYCYIEDENAKLKGLVYTNDLGEYAIKELPKRSKCILYFDKITTKKVEVSGLTLNVNLDSAHFDGTSCIDNTCRYQENGVYEAPDDDGTSYYYRGSVENNYVKFGKMGNTNSGEDIWWRIMRINGDGSIRMIFAGTSTTDNAPAQTGTGTEINNGAKYTFSPGGERNDNKYVGFEYQDNVRNGNSKGANGHKSNALEVLETWFKTNLNDEFGDGINTKIDTNAGFCADRTTYNYDTKERDDTLGIGNDKTYYGGYIRTYQKEEPSFRCEDKAHDLFTYEKANQGTQSLTYPIGLPTIDEHIYAGCYWRGKNEKYYLYNNQYYWTMTPYMFYIAGAKIYEIDLSGGPGDQYVYRDRGLRPVINLKSGVLINGTGAPDDPFVVA